MLDKDMTAGLWQNVVPGMESGTLYSRTTGDSATPVTIENAKKQKITEDDTYMADGVLMKADAKWQFWADELQDVYIKKDDWFIDANGTKWIFVSVEQKLFGNVTECLSRRAVGPAVRNLAASNQLFLNQSV